MSHMTFSFSEIEEVKSAAWTHVEASSWMDW